MEQPEMRVINKIRVKGSRNLCLIERAAGVENILSPPFFQIYGRKLVYSFYIYKIVPARINKFLEFCCILWKLL